MYFDCIHSKYVVNLYVYSFYNESKNIFNNVLLQLDITGLKDLPRRKYISLNVQCNQFDAESDTKMKVWHMPYVLSRKKKKKSVI